MTTREFVHGLLGIAIGAWTLAGLAVAATYPLGLADNTDIASLLACAVLGAAASLAGAAIGFRYATRRFR